MKPRTLFGFEILFGGAAGALVLTTLAVGCGSDETVGCEATQTCVSTEQGGGGGEESGGTSGASGSGGTGGASGSGGRGGSGATGGTGETGGTAGTTGPGGDGGGGMGGNGTDETPPTIVSVEPADGEIGVRSNANLVITFSEPMDRVTTQAAYQSADIPAAGVTFSWNAASTVLAVNPNSDLAYAAGTNLTAVVARQFAASVTNTAEDAAGNALEDDFDWSFRTARRITQTLPVDGHTAYYNASFMLIGFNNCVSDTLNVPAGDGGNGGFHQTFVEADISSLPAGIVAWESAELTAQQNLTQGEPFPSLGMFRIEHIRVDPLSSVVPTSATRHALGTFPAAASPVTRVANVLPALEDDYGDVDVSQVRIGFEIRDNGDNIDDYVTFDCSGFELETVYLVP